MKTVVGLAASYQDAEILVQELMARGFKREDLVLIGEKPEGIQEKESNCGFFSSVEEFFGTEEERRIIDSYAEGVRRGGMLVSVFAEDEDIDRVEEIMTERGVQGIENWVQIFSPAKFTTPNETPDGKRVAKKNIRIYDHSSF